MTLWDAVSVKDKEEKPKELMLVEDITTWWAKHVPDATDKEKLLEENVVHAVGIKLFLDHRISVLLSNLAPAITMSWNLSIWEMKLWMELQEIYWLGSYKLHIKGFQEEVSNYMLIFSCPWRR